MNDPTTVVHCQRADYDVYIGRPSIWGNQWTHVPSAMARYRVSTRAEAIARYREWILTQPVLLAQLYKLKGKRLGCWCKPHHACHGDVLAELADALPDPP